MAPFPPTISRLIHPLLPCAKQKTMNLSILPVCNSLLSVLSQKHAVSLLLFEINFILPVVHRCFVSMNALLLISGHGLKFVRALCARVVISWPPHIQYASAAYGIYHYISCTFHRERVMRHVHVLS